MFVLDHIGIVVPNLKQSVELYTTMLGYPLDAVEYHDVPSEGVKVAMLKGNTKLELLEPTNPDGALGKFLEKRGGGFHHYAFKASEPLQDKLDTLNAAGFRLLDEAPRKGAEGLVLFVHPKSAGGILTEFCEGH